MASGTFKFYGYGLERLVEQGMNYLTADMKVMMTNASHSPTVDDNHAYSNISAWEVSDANGVYVSGGASLASKTVTYDTASNQVRFGAADQTWANSEISNAKNAVVYLDTGTDSTSYLLGFAIFDATVSSQDGDFKLDFHTDGLFYIDVED